jgi:hypothetical protein
VNKTIYRTTLGYLAMRGVYHILEKKPLKGVVELGLTALGIWADRRPA